MAIGRHHIVLLGRFFDAFIRKGILKSFGVLVPALTVYLGTNYTTIGLILSLNAAFTQLACKYLIYLFIRLILYYIKHDNDSNNNDNQKTCLKVNSQK